jgi:hypothetical protein
MCLSRNNSDAKKAHAGRTSVLAGSPGGARLRRALINPYVVGEETIRARRSLALPQVGLIQWRRGRHEHFTHDTIVASHFIINTLLQRGVLRRSETQNRFNGFYARSKTAEAVRTVPPHSYPAEAGC